MKTATQTQIEEATAKLQAARKHLWNKGPRASIFDYKAVRDALAVVEGLKKQSADEMSVWVRSQGGK